MANKYCRACGCYIPIDFDLCPACHDRNYEVSMQVTPYANAYREMGGNGYIDAYNTYDAYRKAIERAYSNRAAALYQAGTHRY